MTLIETMIVVAIVAVLAAIALPLYRNNQSRAAENACLAEMKTYVTWVTAALVNETVLPVPPQQACTSSEAAGADTLSITGIPRQPGQRTVTCDVLRAACTVGP
jgi:type IV pilus assembly protein PilA